MTQSLVFEGGPLPESKSPRAHAKFNMSLLNLFFRKSGTSGNMRLRPSEVVLIGLLGKTGLDWQASHVGRKGQCRLVFSNMQFLLSNRFKQHNVYIYVYIHVLI